MLEALLKNIAGELILLIILIVVSLPFMMIKLFTSKKLDDLDKKYGKVEVKDKKLLRTTISISCSIIITVAVSCIIAFGYSINVLEEDFILLCILATFIAVYFISDSISTLLYCKKVVGFYKNKK